MIPLFDHFFQAFSLPSRNVGSVHQGYNKKTIDMTPRCYGGSVARGDAADIRAAEVTADYKAKARKADREFSRVPSLCGTGLRPVLALLRSMPPATGLVVGTRG